MEEQNKKHYVDLWMKQSQLFWQTVYQVPFIAGAMFAGWFALKSAAQDSLAQGLLCIGIVSMAVQVLILRRMAQYLVTFRQAADRLIPSVPSAIAGLSGYILGTVVPVLIVFFFVALLIWSPSFNTTEPPSSQSTAVTSPVGVVQLAVSGPALPAVSQQGTSNSSPKRMSTP